MPHTLPRNALSLFPGSGAAIATVPGSNGLEAWSPSARRDARLRKRRSQYLCRIDVSAAASIFTVLLFIFMITTSSHPTHEVGVDLPRTKHFTWLPGARREDSIRVALTRDGKVYIGNRQTTFDRLPNVIREALRAGAEKHIYILADARARYLEVKTALDEIRESGVERVSFITESATPRF